MIFDFSRPKHFQQCDLPISTLLNFVGQHCCESSYGVCREYVHGSIRDQADREVLLNHHPLASNQLSSQLYRNKTFSLINVALNHLSMFVLDIVCKGIQHWVSYNFENFLRKLNFVAFMKCWNFNRIRTVSLIWYRGFRIGLALADSEVK